jgi:hypothetical protein
VLPLLLDACLSLRSLPAGHIPATTPRPDQPPTFRFELFTAPRLLPSLFRLGRDDWACVSHDGMHHVRANTRWNTQPRCLFSCTTCSSHTTSAVLRAVRRYARAHQRKIALLDAVNGRRPPITCFRRLSPVRDNNF